ncbi:hypothetical protein EIP91_004443 [Steccherinum ochraceum]|uniref:Uncharacterized protein n=1 Tax=Steccherinum ochraceum TaxID=92696 RepID=A0A4R0RHD2_9APHY|nr:hypothetical protein EIP91_004443 [Steccherinum ochraceum]
MPSLPVLRKLASFRAPLSRSLKVQYLSITTFLVFVLAMSVPLHTWYTIGKAISSAQNTLTWAVPPPERVTIHIIPASVHFDMGTPAWDNLLPSGGHTIHLDEPDGSVSTHTVAMFHQLRCIEILHRAYFNEGSHRTDELPQHCLNYLRETFSCHMDMRLEPQGSSFTHNGFESLCYDWDGLFDEAERNHHAYAKRLA